MGGDTSPRAGARAEAGRAARRYGRTASLLSVAVGITGFIVYLYFALAAHNLDTADYGNIATLWLVVFVTVATLYRPVEQLLSRTIAERHARAGFRGRPLRVAATIQGTIAITVTALCLALRGPIEDELLSGDSTLYWILVISIAAYAGTFFARGFFAGHRRFGLYSAVLLSDACTRILFPLAVAVGIASGTTAIALGIAAGPLVSLTLAPVVVAIAWRGRGIEPEPAPEASGPPAESADGTEFTLAHGGGFAAAVLGIVFSEQLFLSSGALVLRVTEGEVATAFIFNVLMLARAPIYLFQAVATSLLPHLTRLRFRPAAGGEDAFRLSIRVTITAVIGFAAIVAAIVLVAGPALMQVAFSDRFSYDRVGLLIVTAGMGFYLAAATLNQAALAQGQARRASICWIACAVAYVAWNLSPFLDEFRRVEVGFAVASVLLCALLYALYRRPHPRPDDAVRPDSPHELEAQLAAADEAG